MRAQSSFEYLIIISIVIAFLIPIWAYVLNTQQGTTDELSLTYAGNAVKKIADIASLVYSQGPPAKVTVRIYVPGGVEGIFVINTTINMRVRTSSGFSDVFEVSTATMNMTQGFNDTLLIEGTHLIKIEAVNGVVQISSG